MCIRDSSRNGSYSVSTSKFKGSTNAEADCGPLLNRGRPDWRSPSSCPHRVREYNDNLRNTRQVWSVQGYLKHRCRTKLRSQKSDQTVGGRSCKGMECLCVYVSSCKLSSIALQHEQWQDLAVQVGQVGKRLGCKQMKTVMKTLLKDAQGKESDLETQIVLRKGTRLPLDARMSAITRQPTQAFGEASYCRSSMHSATEVES